MEKADDSDSDREVSLGIGHWGLRSLSADTVGRVTPSGQAM